MRRPSIDRFALALGAYSGVLVTIVFASLFDRALLAGWSIAVGVAGLIAVWLVVAFGPDSWRSVADARIHEALALAPVIVLLAALGLEDAGIVPKSAVGIDALLGLGGLLGCGVALQLLIQRRRAARVESRETARVEWTATPGTHSRWYRRAALVGLGVVLFAGGTALWFRSRLLGSLVMGFGISAGFHLRDVGDAKYLVAYESGLTVRDSLDATPGFVPWSRFTGYERTDDALVLRRRLPLAGYRCALDETDDPDAIEAALRDVF